MAGRIALEYITGHSRTILQSLYSVPDTLGHQDERFANIIAHDVKMCAVPKQPNVCFLDIYI
jgi:hypothetical protein